MLECFDWRRPNQRQGQRWKPRRSCKTFRTRWGEFQPRKINGWQVAKQTQWCKKNPKLWGLAPTELQTESTQIPTRDPTASKAKYATCDTTHHPTASKAKHATYDTSHYPTASKAKHATYDTTHYPTASKAKHATCDTTRQRR
jgi:hypothetical protein